MKKSYLYVFAVMLLALTSCNDLLDKEPRDQFINNPSFWSNQYEVENYCNMFYNTAFSGYGQSGSGGDFYFSSLGDDQVNPNFDNWTFTSVPQTASAWSSNFAEIRRANYLIKGMETSTLSTADKEKYTAIGRLNRALHYYRLVRAYGDVQWLEEVVMDADPNNPLVQGERTDRDVVMDNVLADLDYAIGHLGNSNKVVWSKDMALALKSEICLFEGTYCKYRTANENGKAPAPARVQKYLQECVAASQALMNAGYALNDEYGTIYNSIDLSGNKEAIVIRKYVKDVLGHSTVDYTTGSTAQRGISKDAVDAFLFLDGKPLKSTALSTSDAPELDANGHYSIEKMLSVRDKRLGVLVDHVLAFKGHGYARHPDLAEMTASTGYTIAKYDTDQMGDAKTQNYYRNNIGTGYTDAPIYWLAVIYLNYAEAKAELGGITQGDLDNSVNKLQMRAGLPGITLSPAPDPANTYGVDPLLWEIRRARRCELMTDGFRYWDLLRWHQLDRLDSNKHGNIMLGANLSVVPNCEVALKDGYAIGTSAARVFDGKYYLYPIPTNQIQNSKATKQNPGW